MYQIKRHEKSRRIIYKISILNEKMCKNCEGLSRSVFLDGNSALMLGKVIGLVYKKDMPPEDKKKNSLFSSIL